MLQENEVKALLDIRAVRSTVLIQLQIFACKLRAEGMTLDDIRIEVADKFHVQLGKCRLCVYFKDKWAPELKKQRDLLDAAVDNEVPIARPSHRLREYERIYHALFNAGDYKGAAGVLYMVAKERGQIVDRSEVSGSVKYESVQVSFGGVPYVPKDYVPGEPARMN